MSAIEAAGGCSAKAEAPLGAVRSPVPGPVAPAAVLAAWPAECPGDPRAIGEWLARVRDDLAAARRRSG